LIIAVFGCQGLTDPDVLHQQQLSFVWLSGYDNLDIHLVNADGTGLINLTDHPEWDAEHSWSPDGSRIAFFSWRDSVGLFVMNADGTGPRHFVMGVGPPVWSPTGQHLAFATRDIYRFSIDDWQIEPVTNVESTSFYYHCESPAWSPDGQSIAFVYVDNPFYRAPAAAEPAAGLRTDSMPPGTIDVYVIRADGSDLRRLTESPEDPEWQPQWSPDGRHLAFATVRGIRLLAVNGSEDMLLETGGRPDNLAWSPDGTGLLFTMGRDEASDIYTIRSEGGGLRRLTGAPWRDFAPSWSPDGRWIAFLSDRQNEYALWVMNADGSAASMVQRLRDPGGRTRDIDMVLSYGEVRWRP
jgi:TolB protein